MSLIDIHVSRWLVDLLYIRTCNRPTIATMIYNRNSGSRQTDGRKTCGP